MPKFTSRIQGHDSSGRRAFLLGAGLPLLAAASPNPPQGQEILVRGQAQGRQQDESDKRLPNGRLRSDAILKEDYEHNLEDLEKMTSLIKDVQDELKESKGYVLSMENLKRLEEVEKLSRRVRDRMKRD
jgi:predicted  nucleic acid-binding Zn-ribbon protein